MPALKQPSPILKSETQTVQSQNMLGLLRLRYLPSAYMDLLGHCPDGKVGEIPCDSMDSELICRVSYVVYKA